MAKQRTQEKWVTWKSRRESWLSSKWKWRRKLLLRSLRVLFRFKYAFSQEKKKKQQRWFLLLPPIRNFLALIITKCGSICLCRRDECQWQWKAVIRGEKKKSLFLCFLEQSSVEHFRCSYSDYCSSALPVTRLFL